MIPFVLPVEAELQEDRSRNDVPATGASLAVHHKAPTFARWALGGWALNPLAWTKRNSCLDTLLRSSITCPTSPARVAGVHRDKDPEAGFHQDVAAFEAYPRVVRLQGLLDRHHLLPHHGEHLRKATGKDSGIILGRNSTPCTENLFPISVASPPPPGERVSSRMFHAP